MIKTHVKRGMQDQCYVKIPLRGREPSESCT